MSTVTVAKTIPLDHLDPIVVVPPATRHLHNEFQVLNAWSHGLLFLYKEMQRIERHALSNPLLATLSTSATKETEGLLRRTWNWILFRLPLPKGARILLPSDPIFSNRACCFQWYAVTLCNFVELVGAIGWELDKKRDPPQQYLKRVIPDVLAYRHNVAAHISRSRAKTTPADKFASLLPPSLLMNDRYFAGGYSVSIRRSGAHTTSGARQWSLTKTHEDLAPRYWPDLQTV